MGFVKPEIDPKVAEVRAIIQQRSTRGFRTDEVIELILECIELLAEHHDDHETRIIALGG